MVQFNFDFLTRKKAIEQSSQLERVLGLYDATAIGISGTLGAGIYVITGIILTKYTGPSIVLSFMIAGITTLFSALYYAELGSRIAKSGSAYAYIYITIGEFFAFVIGWDAILGLMIINACVGNVLSHYIDSLTGKNIESFLLKIVPMNINGLGPYVNLFSFLIIILYIYPMFIGTKKSNFANKILTTTNLFMLLIIIIAGFTQVDLKNWKIQTENLSWIDLDGKNQSCANSDRCGKGGFMPFGLTGVFSGAAKALFAYGGFDFIAAAGAEVINPKKNVPLSMLLTILVAMMLYCCLSLSLTLMIPYYILDPNTALIHGFAYNNLDWIKYIVNSGTIFSLITCIYAASYTISRIIYSMADDGLIFRFLAKLLPKYNTPYIASLISLFFSATMSSLFDIAELADMVSIGFIAAYTFISVCVIILRYRPENHSRIKLSSISQLFLDLKSLFKPAKEADHTSYKIVTIITSITTLTAFFLALTLKFIASFTTFYASLTISSLCLIMIINLVFIWIQPQNSSIETFKAPLIPFLPFLNIVLNFYLFTTFNFFAYIRFLIWFLIGMFVYSSYGAKESDENKCNNKQVLCFPCLIYTDSDELENNTESENNKDMNVEDVVFNRSEVID